MPEYGVAMTYTTRAEQPDEPMLNIVNYSLKFNFERTKEQHPEWGLPEWDKVEIKHRLPRPLHEILPCEHGHGPNAEDEPLYEFCEVDGCDGFIEGAFLGKYEQAIGWYVNTG